jgi:hypothetical protein
MSPNYVSQLSFGPESFVFRFAVQKFKYYDIQNYNFACCLYGCETWSLTLREERRLRLFENRVPRIIFGPKRDEVTGEWRKLHNEELNVLYSSPDIFRIIKSRRMRWTGHVARMGERRGVYRISVGKPERERPLERPRHRWENNIKMDLQEVGCEGVWTGSSLLRTRTCGGHS